MSSPAIHSRSFPSSNTPAFVRLLKELFSATPLYLLWSSLQGQPRSGR